MKQIWDTEELSQYWSLSFEEIELLKTKPIKSHLGFCMQLKYYQYSGTFLRNESDFSDIPFQYLMEQLEVDANSLDSYNWCNDRTAQRHKQEILNFLGVRKFRTIDKKALIVWLCDKVFPNGHTPKDALDYVREWLQSHKIDSPTEKQLARIIASGYGNFETKLFSDLTSSIPLTVQDSMEQCLMRDTSDSDLSFSQLKSDPGRIGLDAVLKEIDKLNFLIDFDLPEDKISLINSKILNRLKQRIGSETAWEVKRHPVVIRQALMSIFFYTRKSEILDNLVELLIQIVGRLSSRAEKRVVKTLIKDFRKVYGKNALLMRMAEAALENPDGIIKDIVYPIVNEQTLYNIVKEYKVSGKGYKKEVHRLIRSSYGSHYRKMVPKILDSMNFRSNNSVHAPILDALQWIKSHHGSKSQYYQLSESIPIKEVIRPKWYDMMVELDDKGEERINRINYEICVLETLRDKLRCKEVWVEGADRYRNPDEDLPKDFQVNRDFYYNDLGITQDAKSFTDMLQQKMNESLKSFNDSITGNKKVRLVKTDKKRIVLNPLQEQPEPIHINQLKGQVQANWPMTSLLDILKETDLRIGFSDCFRTQRTTERLDRSTLQKRLLLTLYGLGTNTGLKRISASRHGVSYKELLHIRRFYVHKNAMREAIRNVANAIFEVRNPKLWGEGTTACASDSKKFGSWDQNLMTEWHIRYGGRGVMIYWHVEKKSTCIYSQLKRCSSSEVAAMIEGVLRHCTEMSVEKQYVDTHGQSEVAFAFCHLLGFELMPRLKNITNQKLYLPSTDVADNYQNISPILTREINWNLILQQYDQMIKYTTALKQRTADPEAILRRFTRGNTTHPTYKALSELGKVIKTIFLCKYLQNEEIRQEIHEGLNVIENWNSANSFIFFGKGGEVSTNRLEDQELSVLALHLVQICLVYINTLMIQQVTSAENWNHVLTKEDYRALSPLIYAHINPYGVFELNMNERLPLVA